LWRPWLKATQGRAQSICRVIGTEAEEGNERTTRKSLEQRLVNWDVSGVIFKIRPPSAYLN